METAENVLVRRVPEGRRGRVARQQLPAVIPEARSQPVSRARKGRRLAVALRGDIEPEAPAIVRIDKARRRDGGPNAVDKAEWKDPTDDRPSAARSAKTVRGYTRGCALTRIQKSGSNEITDAHIRTANYIRSRFDVGALGFSAERDGSPVTQIIYGPILDFSNGAHARVRAQQEFTRIWNTLTPRQQRMTDTIILQNYSLPMWCKTEEERCGFRLNPQCELGKLADMLDGLTKFLEQDVREEVDKGRMRV